MAQPKFTIRKAERLRRFYAKYKQKKCNEIRNSGKKRISTYLLANHFGVCQSTMHDLLAGKTYRVKGSQ